jgi:hypothetical protein
MGHAKTVWRPPIKDKEGRTTASGYALMHADMLKRCTKDCTKEANFDCRECKRQKVIDYIIKKHIRRHAVGTPMNCICDYATCDIMSVGICKRNITTNKLQELIKDETPLKVEAS